MNCYGPVDPWGAVYFGVCFLALISSVCGLCVDAPTSGLRDLCSFHLCGDNVTPRSTAVHTRCFVEHSVMDSDGKSFVPDSVITQSQKEYFSPSPRQCLEQWCFLSGCNRANAS